MKALAEWSAQYAEDLKSEDSVAEGALFPEKGRLIDSFKQGYNGPLAIEAVEKVLTELFFGIVNSIRPIRVAYLGPEGTFSSIACTTIFGTSVDTLSQKTIPDVFREVESGDAAFGVVPIENSTEGAVTYTLDELIETDLSIIAEQYVRISYSVLSHGADISSIKKIYSHPQPLGQCKGWIRANVPGAEIISVDSTTTAAGEARKDETAAAIAAHVAAEIYGLNVLATRVEDIRQNYTRFFVIGRMANRTTGNDKTSIVCAVKDKPAALVKLLQPFADAGINMTKIESRPDKKKMWEYNFFIDFIGHRDEGKIQQALERMREETVFLKILGSYPVGK